MTTAPMAALICRFLRAGSCSSIDTAVVHCLCERALLSAEMLHFLPSEVVAAAVFMAKTLARRLGKNATGTGNVLEASSIALVWTPTLQYYTGYSVAQLRPCVHALQHLLSQETYERTRLYSRTLLAKHHMLLPANSSTATFRRTWPAVSSSSSSSSCPSALLASNDTASSSRNSGDYRSLLFVLQDIVNSSEAGPTSTPTSTSLSLFGGASAGTAFSAPTSTATTAHISGVSGVSGGGGDARSHTAQPMQQVDRQLLALRRYQAYIPCILEHLCTTVVDAHATSLSLPPTWMSPHGGSSKSPVPGLSTGGKNQKPALAVGAPAADTFASPDLHGRACGIGDNLRLRLRPRGDSVQSSSATTAVVTYSAPAVSDASNTAMMAPPLGHNHVPSGRWTRSRSASSNTGGTSTKAHATSTGSGCAASSLSGDLDDCSTIATDRSSGVSTLASRSASTGSCDSANSASADSGGAGAGANKECASDSQGSSYSLVGCSHQHKHQQKQEQEQMMFRPITGPSTIFLSASASEDSQLTDPDSITPVPTMTHKSCSYVGKRRFADESPATSSAAYAGADTTTSFAVSSSSSSSTIFRPRREDVSANKREKQPAAEPTRSVFMWRLDDTAVVKQKYGLSLPAGELYRSAAELTVALLDATVRGCSRSAAASGADSASASCAAHHIDTSGLHQLDMVYSYEQGQGQGQQEPLELLDSVQHKYRSVYSKLVTCPPIFPNAPNRVSRY